MRRSSVAVMPLAMLAAALVLAACAPGATPPPTPTPRTLDGLPVVVATVGATPLRLAVADDKRLGLGGVAELGDLDGMLFDYGREVAPAAHPFWMADVRIPLEIAFFDDAGAPVDRVSMEPCAADADCPTHVAAAPFRWVIETPPGTLESGGRLSIASP